MKRLLSTLLVIAALFGAATVSTVVAPLPAHACDGSC